MEATAGAKRQERLGLFQKQKGARRLEPPDQRLQRDPDEGGSQAGRLWVLRPPSEPLCLLPSSILSLFGCLRLKC